MPEDSVQTLDEWDPAIFMKDAEPCTLFQDVTDELAEKRSKQLFDPYFLERARDWNYLAKRQVGYAL